MKKLLFIILILFAGNATASSLPNCPSDSFIIRHNCFDTSELFNGDRYVGEFKDGNYHGQGTYTFANGNKYVGEFKDNKKYGQGTFTFTNGVKYTGEWINDIFLDKSKERLAIERAEKITSTIYNACLLDKSKEVDMQVSAISKAVYKTCEDIAADPSWYENFKYNK